MDDDAEQPECPDDCPECGGNGYTLQLGPNGIERAACWRAGIDAWRDHREGIQR